MKTLSEDAARTEAESLLILAHLDEFNSMYLLECEKRGVGLITLSRTIYRTVTEIEAMTLERMGWRRADDRSL
jgi:hypothetical protein